MTLFKGLDCGVAFESGHQYLRVDTSVWCDGSNEAFRRLLGVTIPFVLLYQVNGWNVSSPDKSA